MQRENTKMKETYEINISVDEDHSPEEALREVLRLVEEGYSSGIDPNFEIVKTEVEEIKQGETEK